MKSKERRVNNPELNAEAIARGLKRRREDKLNSYFYIGAIVSLSLLLLIFAIGSFFV